jgi:Carboxypeptidase regulatory-like domain
MNRKKCLLFMLASTLLLVCTVAVIPARAQSITTGDVTGIVTDPSGAVVPNASVQLKNTDTGAAQQRTTNTQGVYRFQLLAPGNYTVTASASGFQTVAQTVSIVVGQATAANLQLAVASSSQTVEVTAESGVVQTEPGNIATTYTTQQIENTPNPGNDLSYIVQTAPGAVMNTQAGYGNSALYGLPATSNLFTVDGANENDPFLNLNNSGATNLLLGQNDIQTATVVNNGYQGQYGGLAGANVNYVTKSGTNNWHGNATYFWNGRIMNANNYFNNQSGTPRPFDNANQWAASIGGPIVKDKTFFFINTEGLRVLLPTNTLVKIPSPQFEAATLANLSGGTAAQRSAVPFYNQMFNLYNHAPGANRATPIDAATDPTLGCGSPIVGGGGLGTTIPCADQFRSTAGNQTNEWLLTARVDQNIGSSDRLFAHFRTDHGLQATYTDPINSAFNASSNQPQYEGQLNWSHTLSANAVNQFVFSTSWYSAIFSPANLAQATALMPFRLGFVGGSVAGTFYSLGRDLQIWPQGRNVTQYGVVDDYSVQKGNHALKFGINFRRNDVSDYSPGIGSIGNATSEDPTDFFNGVTTFYQQNFPTKLKVPIALYTLGLYAQDEVTLRNNFKLTFALRADHNSNPVCQNDCFNRPPSSFLALNHDPSIPYNQAINTNLHQALPNYQAISWQPRMGFAWSPHGTSGTDVSVIRGGVGLFADAFPATVVDNFLANPPFNNLFQLTGLPLTPAPGGITSAAAGANAAFLSGFSSGGTLASISATNPAFAPPTLNTAAHLIHNPTYAEWNLEFQQSIGAKTSFTINYVGNHGWYGTSQNGGFNAFCNATCAAAGGFSLPFANLPAAQLDQRFSTVFEVQTNGISNYNGLSLSLARRFASLQIQANYTWSHALDEISNAGFLPFNFATNTSILNPEDPYNIRRNYGNSDYDVRHNLNMNYTWTSPRMRGVLGAIGDWTISGNIFYRTGYPLTVVDSAATSNLNGFNYGTTTNVGPQIFANYNGGASPGCTRAAVAPFSGPATPCLAAPAFTPAVAGYGLQNRNQFYGPFYFNMDLTVMKNFHIPHWESGKFGIGLQAFNVLNHVNFDQPVNDIASSNFGTIINTVSTPTSIVGSFLGGDASPRMLQIKAQLTW